MKKITVEIEVTDLMYECWGDCGEDADCDNCECRIGTDDCIFNHEITDSEAEK